MIFWEDEVAHFYHQIQSGTVRVYNINDEGREFTQGIFSDGNSFGEPPLFSQDTYAASAIAMTDAVIYKLNIEGFQRLLKEYPEVQHGFNVLFAKRLYDKACMAREIINSPESRILAFLKKTKHAATKEEGLFRIPYTRQEIANSTGLRVETVIRTLKRMVKENKVEVKGHKLFY